MAPLMGEPPLRISNWLCIIDLVASTIYTRGHFRRVQLTAKDFPGKIWGASSLSKQVREEGSLMNCIVYGRGSPLPHFRPSGRLWRLGKGDPSRLPQNSNFHYRSECQESKTALKIWAGKDPDGRAPPTV